MNDGIIVVDPEWVIEYVNVVAAELVEHTAAEMVSRSFWDVFPEAYDHEFGIAYRKAMEAQVEERIEAYYGPLRGWFDVRVIPTLGGLTFCFQNVNERRAATAAQDALVNAIMTLAEASTVEEIATALEVAAADILGIHVAVTFDEHGVLRLLCADSIGLDPHGHRMLQALEGQGGAAVERTRVLLRQRAIAETLQQAMLPSALPEIGGAELAACYLPATADLSVGGDWYDALVLRDSSLVLAVGDVAGHGVDAAAAMGQVRNALRAYAIDGHEPAAMLHKLDVLIDEAGHDLLSTAIVAIFDPASGRLRWSSAGHLPPLVRTTTGTRFLEVPVGAPLGVRGPNGFVDAEVVLEPGDLFIAYTDGLVERRGEDLDDGLEALRRNVDRVTAPTAEAWNATVDAIAGGHRGDDICVLALRRT